MPSEVRIGIVGGSGLYQMDALTNIEEVAVDTPFGKPSDTYRVGTLEGQRVAFLARHNRSHTILPSELNFRANIYGFKKLGVEWIISASAVGSLKEEHRPLDISGKTPAGADTSIRCCKIAGPPHIWNEFRSASSAVVVCTTWRRSPTARK